MRKTNALRELQGRKLIFLTVVALVLALSLALSVERFSIVSHAESAGRVTAASANVRSSASASANVLASVKQNDTVAIRGQVQATDGKIWYEVYVDANTLGYIRSDLVEITDGSTPPTSTQVAATEPQTDNNNNAGATSEGVSAVNPVSATVTGNGSVRIRSNASASSQIVTTVQNGLALTVVGQADGSDGKVWYQVNFISGNSEVSGFIRSDFVELSEELTPYTAPEPEPEPEGDAEPDTAPEPETTMAWYTMERDGKWFLVESATSDGWVIDDIFAQLQSSKTSYEERDKLVKTERNWLIILVILLVFAVGAVAFLVFKMKDMMDSAYFNEVEKETLRKKTNQGGSRLTHTVGNDRRGMGQGQRPSAVKSAGAAQGQRPVGEQGQRPGGSPQGQRPSSVKSAGAQGQRPSGAQGQKSAGAAQGQRSSGAQSQRSAMTAQGQKSAGSAQGQRAAGSAQGQTAKTQAKPAGGQGWQSKNFMADDEFEFDFLNYDGEDE